MIQNLNADLLRDPIAFGRLLSCLRISSIGDMRLISDKIVARLAEDRANLQPRPWLREGLR
jgi:hypothetical protein